MTHIINDKCYKCKYTDCVDVCPVDCFHEGEDMLVIDPDVCIDCGVCIIECPVNAIMPNDASVDGKKNEDLFNESLKNDILTYEQKKVVWLHKYNNVYSKMWPKITKKKDKHPQEEIFSKIDDKIKYISNDF